jgi:hypothetical protein
MLESDVRAVPSGHWLLGRWSATRCHGALLQSVRCGDLRDPASPVSSTLAWTWCQRSGNGHDREHPYLWRVAGEPR